MIAPLRIVFITGFAHTQGTYFRWHNWAIGLKELGHHVSVYAIEKDNASKGRLEKRDGIDYHILPSSRGQSIFDHNSHPLNLLKAFFYPLPPADVYHIIQPFPISALRGLWNRKNAKLLVYDWDDLWYGGLIGSENSGDPFYKRIATWAIKKTEQFMPSKADAVTVCGSYLEQKAIDRGAKVTQKIYNGFWEESISRNKQEVRKQMGFNENDFYFGFMGRTTEELDWCFDVLRQQEDANVKLALCGMNTALYEPFKKEFQDRVLFLGQLSPKEAKDFACAIDCGLLPLEDNDFNKSRFPIKFAEYLSSGANVICSDVGEVAYLGRNFQGILFAGTTREAWKDAILDFIKLKNEGSIQLPIPTQIAEKLDWRVICKELEFFYMINIDKKRHLLYKTPDLSLL